MKKILSFLFAAVLIGNIISVSADDGANIFKGIDAGAYTEVISGKAAVESDGGVFTDGTTVIQYSNVLFDRNATHMDITYSSQEFNAPRELEFRADSPEGEVIASIKLKETTRYTNKVTDRIEVNCNLTGTHNLYLIDLNGGAGRIYNFKMYGTWNETDLSKEEDTAFNNSQKLLYSLDIIDSVKDETNANRLISRKEYAEMLCKAFRANQIKGNPYGFIDENSDFGYLNVLAQKGYIKSVGSYIRPNDKIALADAAEGYIRMSGYGAILDGEKKELTRENVLAIAANYEFLKNVKYVSNVYTSYRDAVNMTVNVLMLSAPKVTINPGANKVKVEYNTDKTILEDVFDAKKSVGIVTANEYTALNTEFEYENDGYVRINQASYLSGESGAENYLGFRVRYYYRTDKDDNSEILFIYDVDKLNKTVVIDSQDIESRDKNTFSYNYKNRTKSETIPLTADFIYNEVCCSNYTDSELDIKEGCISFIDNNGDGRWDVVKVKSAEVYVVDSVDVDENVIYPKIGSEFGTAGLSRIDLNDSGANNVSVMLDGIKNDLQAVKSGYAVSVYDSMRSGSAVMSRIVDISSKVVNAKVVSYSKNDGSITTDSGYTYKKSVACVQDPEVGVRYDLHITVYGTVVWFESTAASRNYEYGFVIRTFVDEEADDAVNVKLLNEDGAIVTIPIYKKAVIDGENASSNKRVLELILNGEATVSPQLIRYKTNSKNEIVMVDTAYRSSNEDRAGSMNQTLRHGDAEYRNSMDYFWLAAPISDDTVIFSMPFSYADIERGITQYNESDYTVMKNARQFAGINSYCEGFDGSTVKPLGAVVKYRNPTNTFSESTAMIYITKKQEVYSDGETVSQIKGIYNGNMVELELTEYAENDYGSYIKEGDLWLFQKDAKGKVTWMMPIWTQNTLSGYTMTYDLRTAHANVGSLYICWGEEILDKYKNNISMKVNGEEYGYSLNNTNIVLYDKKSEVLKTITVDQIPRNSQTSRSQYAFLYAYAKQAKYLVIINE